jgi:hypothetical protein
MITTTFLASTVVGSCTSRRGLVPDSWKTRNCGVDNHPADNLMGSNQLAVLPFSRLFLTIRNDLQYVYK